MLRIDLLKKKKTSNSQSLIFFSVPEAVDVWMQISGKQNYVVWKVSALEVICPHNKTK